MSIPSIHKHIHSSKIFDKICSRKNQWCELGSSVSMNPSCDRSEDASEAGEEGKEYGDIVRCEGPLSLAIDDVLDVRFCVLELVAVVTGEAEAPCP